MLEQPDCGKMVCGTWTLLREIGRGGHGVVYLATGIEGEMVAVKVYRRDRMSPDHYERELHGAKLYKSIRAVEGLVRMLGFGECEWGFYSVMELADDEFDGSLNGTLNYHPKTLARIVAGEKALTLDESLTLGIALAKGLVILQRHHLLHRDIKPSNVIYVRGNPVLADWGLIADETESFVHVGTPGYAPPENFTEASGDIYSLGMTLKVASFGRQIGEINRGPTLEADTDNPQFPVWWRILNKATESSASRRYRSAKALLKDLVALHRRMSLSEFIRPHELPIHVWFAVLAMVVLSMLGVLIMAIIKYIWVANDIPELP